MCSGMSTLRPERWLEISPHLDHALSLPDVDRDAWLDSFESQNPELGNILRKLLEEQSGAEGSAFLPCFFISVRTSKSRWTNRKKPRPMPP